MVQLLTTIVQLLTTIVQLLTTIVQCHATELTQITIQVLLWHTCHGKMYHNLLQDNHTGISLICGSSRILLTIYP